MRIPNLVIACLAFFIGTYSLFAQEDSIAVYQMDEIVLKDEALQKQSGFKAVTLDLREETHADLAELLQEQTGVYIKSYGPGALSTTSFRGTGANHTELTWYGIGLNSPSLGQTDFSTVSTDAFQQVDVFYGAASMNNSLGGFGGSILLQNEIGFQQRSRLDLTLDRASFSQNGQSIRWQWGNTKWQYLQLLSHKDAQNDFEYLNTLSPEKQRDVQQNAATEQWMWYQELGYKASATDVLFLRLWWQQNDREIPPVISFPVKAPTGSRQEDQFARGMLEWKHQFPHASLITRTAFVKQQMDFWSSTDADVSENNSDVWHQQIRYSNHRFKKFKLRAGIDLSDYGLTSNGYEERVNEFRWHSFVAADYNWRKWAVHSSLKEVFYQGELKAILPVLGLEYQPSNIPTLRLKANVAKNYRLPSFNDLYWNPGGNKALQAESGQTWEIGALWNKQWDNWQFETEGTYFSSLIDNWILWSPTQSTFWQAENARQVSAKGLESRIKLSYSTGENQWHMNGSYHYQESVNQKTDELLQNALNKQLIYVPKHKWVMGLQFQRKSFRVGMQVNYTGRVFIDRVNESYMPDFSVLSCHVSQQWKNFTLKLRVENMTNVDYQVMANRPMPGRAFYTSIRYTLENK